MKKYKFSVVMPIYNVFEYLEESILSVVEQSIGFEDNIELILVNDGSPDKSEDICLKYKELYPNNIIYIKQENGGVSRARNNGFKVASGEFVSFLDSDDKWNTNSLEEIYNFFQNNEEINVVVGRMRFFETSNKFHMLDYKFNDGSRVIDIFEEPSMLHLHITSSVIRRSKAINYSFDESIKYGEDAKYLNSIIIDDGKYGIVKNAILFYRKRLNNSSAIQNKDNNIEWYTSSLEKYYKYLMDLSKKNYSEVIKYVQYLVMYDYQFRLKKLVPETIPKKAKTHYISESKKILKSIDDEVIATQRYLNSDYKKYAYDLKYNKDIFDEIEYDEQEHILYFHKFPLYKIANKSVFKFYQLKIKNNHLILSARINTILRKKDFKIFIKINNKLEALKLELNHKYACYGMDKELYRNYVFNKKIKLENLHNISFYIQYKNYEPVKLLLNFNLFSKLDRNYKMHYNKDRIRITCKNNELVIGKKNIFKDFFGAIIICYQLLNKQKFKQLFYRICYYFFKLFKTKEIWLVSDRTNAANDNGMHMFKYINKVNDKNIKSYFVINKTSPDFIKMQQYGKVVAYNSFKYKLLFLLSDVIVSSQADLWVYNAFGSSARFYRDLYNFDFVFLQHGIIKDDLSSWLNIYDKDMTIFVTSSKNEYESIINGKYGYDASVVKLTGLPRYDNLQNEEENIIAILPTWRQYLSGKVNVSAGTREYNENFKESEYFNFYNDLINDKKLIKIMKEYGYKGIFVVHPSHVNNSKDFVGNDTFEVITDFADYQTIFKKAKLLISDYSSVPFDFAYLRKPVIYTQFDKQTFFANHLYQEGYFSYERDGFGPVLYEYQDALDTIINYIKNDCQIENKYLKRIEKFYQYNDKSNCKRVYNAIKKR